MVGELGVMEQKEHPWSGCAARRLPLRGARARGDGPRPAAGTRSQLLLGARQDRALLHPYFITSSLADLQGCCLD